MNIRVHESVGPLLRGIGLTIVLIGTIAGAVQVKMRADARQAVLHTKASTTGNKVPVLPAPSQDNSLENLTREVETLRETVQEETVVEDVLTNPLFDVFGILGSAISTASFYVEWLSKRSKPLP